MAGSRKTREYETPTLDDVLGTDDLDKVVGGTGMCQNGRGNSGTCNGGTTAGTCYNGDKPSGGDQVQQNPCVTGASAHVG
mgnify:CR=1 FL=1